MKQSRRYSAHKNGPDEARRIAMTYAVKNCVAILQVFVALSTALELPLFSQ
jgi:hypothetical protein